MAKSSIFANVIIDNDESAQIIAKTFEDFEKNGKPYEAQFPDAFLSSPEEIKEFFN